MLKKRAPIIRRITMRKNAAAALPNLPWQSLRRLRAANSKPKTAAKAATARMIVDFIFLFQCPNGATEGFGALATNTLRLLVVLCLGFLLLD